MKLTPVYVVQVASTIHCGIFHKYKRDRFGDNQAVAVSEAKARKIVETLENEGTGARAYHYGWKQRGFRSDEPYATELCRNKFWTKWVIDRGRLAQ